MRGTRRGRRIGARWGTSSGGASPRSPPGRDAAPGGPAMDGRRFDSLARTVVVGPPSRRRVLAALAGAALGGLLGARPAQEAAAQAGCGRVGDGCIADAD